MRVLRACPQRRPLDLNDIEDRVGKREGKRKGYFSGAWRSAAVLEARLCREFHVDNRGLKA
jgi:hypothetical protein